MSVLRAVYAFIRRIGSIGSMLRDPSVRFWKKLLVVGGIVYLFLPVDLIPPFLLPVGWIDDLAGPVLEEQRCCIGPREEEIPGCI